MKKQKSSTTSLTNSIVSGKVIFVLILISSMILLMVPSTAFPESNISADGTTDQRSEATVLRHLVNVDLSDESFILVTESIVYSLNRSNDENRLMMRIPAGASIMQFTVTDMTDSTSSYNVDYLREGSLLLFDNYAYTGSNEMPFLYDIRYVVPMGDKEPSFSKLLRDEGYFYYNISRFVLVVKHKDNWSPIIRTNDGFPLVAEEIGREPERTTYIWSSPAFDSIDVNVKILDDGSIFNGGHFFWILVGALVFFTILAVGINRKQQDLPNDPDELEALYESELIVLSRIKEDYKDKKLNKEEFDSFYKEHSENLSRIKKKMEKNRNT